MTKEKMMWLLMDIFEKNPKDLFNLFKKRAGGELVFAMTGIKKVGNSANLSPEKIMRIQYSYCAFSLLADENSEEFAKKWLKRGNIFLAEPIKAFRNLSPKSLFMVMNVVLNCIRAQHGIVP